MAAEGVDGGALFNADAGMGDGEAGLADGVQDLVEEADVIPGLDFANAVATPPPGASFSIPKPAPGAGQNPPRSVESSSPP